MDIYYQRETKKYDKLVEKIKKTKKKQRIKQKKDKKETQILQSSKEVMNEMVELNQ